MLARMKMQHALRALVVVALTAMVTGAPAPPPPDAIILKSRALFDGRTLTLRMNAGVLVSGDTIKAVDDIGVLTKQAPNAHVVDLGATTLLPGLIDAHTHIMKSGDDEPYTDDLIKRSIAYRAIAAATRARNALLSGFTSLRDVESEGAMFADADLARAIDAGDAVGPRMQVATRALAPTGGYMPMGVAWDAHVADGAQIVDGVDAIRQAVREQIKHGARWIKIYVSFSQYRTTNPKRPLRSRAGYSLEELNAAVDEAHRYGVKVAAHAMGWDAIDRALRAGVDSIEHGLGLTDDLAQRMTRQGCFLVPTLTVFHSDEKKRPSARATMEVALRNRVLIANGSDVGSAPWKDGLARELALLVEYGMTPAQALQAATSTAAALLDPLCLPERADCPRSRVGFLEPGSLADIIAIEGDPLADIGALAKVTFVMKGGAVFKSPSVQ